MKNPSYKLFFGILSFPLFLLSFLVPRSRNIWVFGAWYGNQYTDNTSYLYEYVKETKPDIKAIWLTRNKHVIQNLRNKGDNVFCKNSIYGLWYGSRAGVTFINCGYDDVNKYCINRSIIVQLWHGVPLKKIKNDDMINENIQHPSLLALIRIISIKLLPFLNERYDLIISSELKVTDRFESAFKIERSKIIETGYPRMDIITTPSFSYIKEKLYDEKLINKCINNGLDELQQPENMTRIQKKLLDPMIYYTYKRLYPYFLVTTIIFLLTFILALLIFIILLKESNLPCEYSCTIQYHTYFTYLLKCWQ